MEALDPPPPGSPPERAAAAAAMAGTAALAVLVTASVAARWLGGLSVPDSVLLVRELMVPVIILPLAAVTAARGHIAVTIFTRRAAGRRLRLLEAAGHLAGIAFVGLLAWAGWLLFEDAAASGGYHDGDLDLPKWMARGVYTLGFAMVLSRLAALLVRDLRSLARGPSPAPSG